MAVGLGKYDDLCTKVRDLAKARGAIIIVIQGEHGSGFSVQGDLELTARLPALMREMANQVEADAFTKAARAVSAGPGLVTMHLLSAGLPLCGFTTQMPREWPEDHMWLGLNEKDRPLPPGCAWCEKCQAAARVQ